MMILENSVKRVRKNLSGFFQVPINIQLLRYCEIPHGVGILFPILNSECSIAEYPNMKTKEELSTCAKKIQDTTVPEFATLNSVIIPNLENYRIQSDIFNFTLPEKNILNLPPQTTKAVSDGIWGIFKASISWRLRT